MVSTFIFGLGDDYSIFTMDGLLQEYKAGKKNLASIRTSIFLSAVTTIAGLGVLVLAQHPALRSIAAISIIGISCVFIMSQTIEPFLFRWLVTRRTEKGFTPMTFHGIFRTSFTYALFGFGAIVLTILGTVFRYVPVFQRQIKFFFHLIFSGFARLIIYIEPSVRKRVIGRSSNTFSRPSVIIANQLHSLIFSLRSCCIPADLVTNQWVWNSPIFGSVVRLADFFPVTEGSEDVLKLKDRFDEGYSLVIFPEGTRSFNGVIGRFHKGAFYIAEKFNLPIQPLLIHGAADAIPKGSFYLNVGQLTLKFLPPVEAADATFGEGYSERTKAVSKYFKREFALLRDELESPRYFYHKLVSNYIYKGPVLEWYMRVKIKLEKYYCRSTKFCLRKAPSLTLAVDMDSCVYASVSFCRKNNSSVDYDEDR